jgi:hypothetical protein
MHAPGTLLLTALLHEPNRTECWEIRAAWRGTSNNLGYEAGNGNANGETKTRIERNGVACKSALLSREAWCCYYPAMAKNILHAVFLAFITACLLAGCSPDYNWRDYSSQTAPYRIMFPNKPDSHTRSVDLAGLKVDMTMTATEIDGTMFAVGSAELPDAARAPAALAAMQTAMLRNIGATAPSERAVAASGKVPPAGDGAPIDIEATGNRNGVPTRLVAHFEARGARVYQVIVIGKPSSMPTEQVKQFMSSFKLI